ncbi:MAG: radical SAM protein [bacterium]|nr:radical SAM protein [bacterium]
MRRFVQPRESFVPAYLPTWESGALADKVGQALEELRRCRVCPRDCDVDRLADEKAVCRTGRHALVSSAFPHFGEEDCLRGWNGSGTIFFAACNLRCVFCQNHDISWQPKGEELDAKQIAALMLELQVRGCHNINFVTPEHVAPQVLEAIGEAVPRGLRLPIVYNTSAFDSLRSLELLDGVVDVYMPDFKFWDPKIAKRLVLAESYPETARAAVKEMHRQVGDLVFDDNGLALRGLLVRHLVMPEGLAGTREVMHFLAEEISTDTYVNVMDQYQPDAQALKRPENYAEIDRPSSSAEVRGAMRTAREEGLHRLDERWRPMSLFF